MIRLWKALPEGVRAFAHRSRQAVLDAATPMLVARHWRPGNPGGAPVTLVGFFGSVIGIGQGARLFLAAARAAGVATDALDAGAAATVAADLPDAANLCTQGASLAGGTVVTCFNPPELRRWLQTGGARWLKGRRHVGYWAWELPEVPAGWQGAFRYVDEVWCPSRFTAEAVRAAAPPRVPVRVLAHPMHLRAGRSASGADRARFGLADDACVVLAAFDLKSTAARKNPMGAIEAYRRAQPVADGGAVLVCKVTGGARWPERLAALRDAVGPRDDIHLLVEDLSDGDMGALIASADIVLSLHRAEGFGLLAAEGLCDGKAVIATAWSGVMDFLDADSAVLVPWRPVSVEDVQGIYAGGWWAEPDLDVAADRLRALIADDAARAALGARARARAAAVFDADAWSARFLALLDGRDPDAA